MSALAPIEKAALVDETIRMALAEVGMVHIYRSATVGTRWRGDAVCTGWQAGSIVMRERWAAQEVAATRVGRKPRCWACHKERHAAYQAGEPQPEPCESFGRMLVLDCGKPRTQEATDD